MYLLEFGIQPVVLHKIAKNIPINFNLPVLQLSDVCLMFGKSAATNMSINLSVIFIKPLIA